MSQCKIKDITGMRYGKLQVLRFAGFGKDNRDRWECLCDCGKIIITNGKDLRQGKSKSCGCGKGKNANDLTNMRFGRLTAIKPIGLKNRSIEWLCKCDCGKEVRVLSYRLLRGYKISCGCHYKHYETHGMHDTRLYRIWAGMKSRCTIPTATGYENYGGRRIKFCDEWNDFEPFRDWALSNGYRDNLSIDRKDNNGNYEPENCRWATELEQQNNKSNNHLVEINGVVKNMKQWCKEYNLNYDTFRTRLNKGWVGEQLLVSSRKAVINE